METVSSWRKSSYSGANGGECVEVGTTAHAVLVRGTTNRNGMPSPGLADEYGVSVRVAQAVLAMLAANRYVTQPGNSGPYRIPWQAALSPGA
jgi:uncharacterized protein DUF397